MCCMTLGVLPAQVPSHGHGVAMGSAAFRCRLSHRYIEYNTVLIIDI